MGLISSAFTRLVSSLWYSEPWHPLYAVRSRNFLESRQLVRVLPQWMLIQSVLPGTSVKISPPLQWCTSRVDTFLPTFLHHFLRRDPLFPWVGIALMQKILSCTCPSPEDFTISAQMSACLRGISVWMRKRQLQPNLLKPELLLFPANPAITQNINIQLGLTSSCYDWWPTSFLWACKPLSRGLVGLHLDIWRIRPFRWSDTIYYPTSFADPGYF